MGWLEAVWLEGSAHESMRPAREVTATDVGAGGQESECA